MLLVLREFQGTPGSMTIVKNQNFATAKNPLYCMFFISCGTIGLMKESSSEGNGAKNFENKHRLSLHEYVKSDYLSSQLITCIGNKRSLIMPIATVVGDIQKRLGGRKLRCADLFSGSGVVSRLLKAYAEFIHSNDIEPYAEALSYCYLTNKSTVDLQTLDFSVFMLNNLVDYLASNNENIGFIEELYSAHDETNITKSDRLFYTKENARRLDIYRTLIEEVDTQFKQLLMGPILSEASIHANTAGVFKGFYKDRKTGIGHFGGTGRDALSRILGKIEISFPALSTFECDYEVTREDANKIAPTLKNMDLVYLDPPYNQHPYGSNYFMLNLIVSYKRPEKISKVSGIPENWQRSGYNNRQKASLLLKDLVEKLDAKFILISFNSEGFITKETMASILEPLGKVTVTSCPYNTFRGSRNLRNRSIHVTEFLYLLEKQ